MNSQLLFYIVFSVVLHLGLGTVNFALHKSAVQSTTEYWNNFEWTADKAVDGNSDGSNPDSSMTCSSTRNTGNQWVNHTWEVNIGPQIIVKTVTVYGRNDGLDMLSGVKLYIGNVSSPWRYNQEIPSITSSREKYVFKPNNAIGSVISLKRFFKILVICEVTVEGECLGGMFSEYCNLTCGKCFADHPCNQENGTCPSGCNQGRKGTLCKEDCERGNYGYNCNETCGNCLFGNNNCSITDGTCSSGCIAGWQGHQCNTECEVGTYGFNCNETCGYCSNGNNSCSKISGQCSGGCQTGWRGEPCTSGLLETVTPGDVGPNTGVIIGSVLAAVGVSISAMVIIIVIVKKRKRNNNETGTENVTPFTNYANVVVGIPDAAIKITVQSREERETAFSAIEETSLQNEMPIGATNIHSGVMEADVLVHNVYEKLRDVPESTESAYSTIYQNLIHDQKMNTIENESNYIETLQELESALKSIEEEIGVLRDRKGKLLCKELERSRAIKLRDQRKETDSSQSDTNKDYTNVDLERKDALERCGNFVEMLQSLEGEMRLLEEKRKCFFERKKTLLTKELAKTFKI